MVIERLRPHPRPDHSVLLITGLLALVLALVLLAEVLGANRPPGAGGLGWIFALEAAAAAVAARHANSAACTLIAALAAGVAAEALVIWIFSPHGLGTARAILLTLTIIYAGMAVRLRDRRRRHAVAFVNAAGLATLTVGATYLVGLIGENPGGAPFGWKAFLVLIGTGLVAYAAIDREPGPGYLGLAVLGTFVVLAGAPVVARGSLVGWPLFLLIIGGAGIGVGLRPRRPLPPSPDANISGAAPTVPLHQQKQP